MVPEEVSGRLSPFGCFSERTGVMNHRASAAAPEWRPTDPDGWRWELWQGALYVGRVMRWEPGRLTIAAVNRTTGTPRFVEWTPRARSLRGAGRELERSRPAARQQGASPHPLAPPRNPGGHGRQGMQSDGHAPGVESARLRGG